MIPKEHYKTKEYARYFSSEKSGGPWLATDSARLQVREDASLSNNF
jgi:hypothetical protein